MLRGLGLVGLDTIEPVILAALITSEPLLLIGPHGTGKPLLLTRVAEALGLEWRHYNASLLNYDDLVGYPLPNGRGQLEFVQTPAAIWGAEAVFVDEISLCRPDLQNKLFPIIHERKVQGIALDKLQHRWGAMNPPATSENDDAGYSGSEPLDRALADRFTLIATMPGWPELGEADQVQLLLHSEADVALEDQEKLRAAVASGRSWLAPLREEMGAQVAGYVRAVLTMLGEARIELSARRAAMLLRNVVAVHAARLLSDPLAAPSDSAYLALAHSLPRAASGEKMDGLKVLAAHREAWAIAGFAPCDPRRLLLAEADPVLRVVRATTLAITREEFSGVVADTLATLRPGGREALAAYLFESGAGGKLVAAIAEQCAALYSNACLPQAINHAVAARSTQHTTWLAIEQALARLPADGADSNLLANLLIGRFGAKELTSEQDVRDVMSEWKRVRVLVREVRR